MLYHDAAVPDGAARRIHSNDLDRAWADARLPRIGVAFGFGTNIIGLLNGSERPVVAAATPVPTTASAPPTLTAPETVPGTGATTVFGGMGPGLIVFLVGLAGGVGYLVARLVR
jgi:hypothetical protein